ncbi:MAG: hypothetical protein ABJB12_05775, partial [Pseudomonadota bacterium]
MKKPSGRAAVCVASALCAAALYPLAESQLTRTRNAAALARIRNTKHPSGEELTPALSLRVQRLEGLLSSWETIGGCGAGTSTGAGGGIKWIG